MRLSCKRPKSSKTACGCWRIGIVQVLLTLSKSSLHMRAQATKSHGNTPKTTSFMQKFFRAPCLMLTSSLEKPWWTLKNAGAGGSTASSLAPTECISWKHTPLHGNSCADQKLLLEAHANQFNSISSKWFFYCKEKHLKGPDSLGTKHYSHVLIMCILSVSQAEWRLQARFIRGVLLLNHKIY